MRLLESQNLYPDCISLELEAVSLASEGTELEQFDLYLSLNFNEQWKSLLNGRIKFGLKGGRLNLKLDHCAIAVAESDFGNAFLLTTEVSQTHPTWICALKTSESHFKGSLSRIKLGRVKTTAQPYNIIATWEVLPSDISLTDAEGLWRHDISPNKHGILERKLIQFLLKTRFKPYLSWLQLGSVDARVSQNLVNLREETINPEDLSQLERLLQSVYEAKTNNFLELAQLAGLNSQEDLAGGNYQAVELSGIELSGANLCHSSFRGATLTDVDFSEANLSHVKFSGADLSGAYLGSANLTYADFHRASLALANLIGADLRCASLQGVNLSQANLSGAQVEKAIFADNTGLSEETRQSLQERGALFP
jgi:uncharacterized protein YjbI with pentapeptide repeats